MDKIHTAVIQAGGRGTRLRELTKNIIPKPMLLMNGKPMLEWQICSLKEYGITHIILIIGYLGEKVKYHFKDGSDYGIKIEYIEEIEPLGSAGSLYYLKNIIKDKNFLLVFGDVMFDVDLDRMESFHFSHKSEATLLAHPNTHPYDSDILVKDDVGRVLNMLPKNKTRNLWYDNCVNAGIYILSVDILEDIEEGKYADLEKDVLMPCIINRKVYAYSTPEYVKDAGTIIRFKEVEDAFDKDIPAKKNLRNKQKCIFLDRDGTINVYHGFVYKPEQLELEKNVAEAICMLNASEYLVILVSNQPVVARGMCSIEDVRIIHNKMTTLLGEKGAYLDDIIFCPHHPDSGYPGENSVYKIKCNCRKPATDMLDKMKEKYNIDFSNSYIIGDTTVDIQTGYNAGIKTVLVHTGEAGKDGKYRVHADIEVLDLMEAVKLILQRGK